MSQSVKVYPPKDFMIAFLSTRNVKVVEDKEHVLHYFGDSFRDLKNVMRNDKPDLLIIHNPELDYDEDYLQKYNYVIDYVLNDKDIYQNKTVKTNNQELCQLYYRKLNLQRSMDIFYRPAMDLPVNKFNSYVRRLCDLMQWK